MNGNARRRIRVLHLEDNPRDAALIGRRLAAGPFDCDLVLAEGREAFESAIAAAPFDLILADYTVPGYGGLFALRLTREKQPAVPFIMLSGELSEEEAVECLRAGASDYLLKSRLQRLLPAVERALAEADERNNRLELEKQLRQSQKMESLGQLARGIAHDFHNLLDVILGNLQPLERVLEENDKALRHLQTAQRAASSAAELTRRLFVFSRRQPLNAQPTSVNDLISGMLRTLDHTLGPEIKLTAHLTDDRPVTSIDAAGLENALLNLATNARDAMPGGGNLTFRTASVKLDENHTPVRAGEIPAGDYVQISVTDTGHGMSRETAERIFEPFFTTKHRGKAAGLGLSMVDGFVKQSQGDIRVHSEEGRGTTMTLYFPVAAGE
jgi:two-component system, cell cycle sensor histidine kinase and response regulator CckA